MTTNDQDRSHPDGISKPDPTTLTTDQLIRAIDALKELLSIRMNGMEALRDEKIANLRASAEQSGHEHKLAIDAALKAAKEASDAIDEKTFHLQALHDEKFRSIQVQFTERDTRTEQTSRDSKVAVDAALQAAKEAVGEQNRSSALSIAKSETSTAKQIDQQALLIATATHALEDKIGDLKDRVTVIEGKGAGVQTQHTAQQTSTTLLVAVFVAVVSLGGLVIALIKMAG